MANQDLFQALGMFQQGVQQYQTVRSISQANEAVNQIKNSTLKDEQKMTQIRGIANDLTLHMVGLGVPETGIKQAYQSVTGLTPNLQTPDQAVINGNDYQQQMGKNLINQDFQQKRQLQAEKLAAEKEMMGIKDGTKDNKNIIKEMDTFQNKVAKTEIDNLTQLKSLRQLVANGDNMSVEMAKRMMLKSSGDNRISDQDVKAAAPDPSAYESLKRSIARISAGKPLPEDLKQMGNVANAMQSAAERSLRTKAKNFSKGRDGLVKGITGDELHSRILQTALGESPAGSAPAPASIGGASAPFDPTQNSTPAQQQPGNANPFIKFLNK